MKNSIREMFDGIAHRYDLLNHLLSFNRDKVWRKKAIEALPGDSCKKVLDICAGTMDLSVEYLENRETGSVIAGDFSMNMLRIGRKKTQSFGDRIYINCVDAMDLPYDRDSFDVVMCGFGMRNLPELSSALGEIARVLKNGGKLCVLDFFNPDKLFTRLFSALYEKCIIPLVGRLVSGSEFAYSYLPESRLEFCDPGGFESLMKDAGFSEITRTDLTFGVATIMKGTIQ